MAPRVQQYSVDLQRELGGDMAVTFSYVGARGDYLPLGGTVNTAVNINQLDPKYLRARLGGAEPAGAESVLRQPGLRRHRVRQRRPLTRGQLLRPFPQFGNISMFQRAKA